MPVRCSAQRFVLPVPQSENGPKNLNTQYCSPDPLNFGINDDRFCVGTLPVAAPVIIVDRGRYYIAALLPDLTGIRIAGLDWVDQERASSNGGGAMDVTISFTVNGRQGTVNVDPQRSLLDVLREDLRLTGTKYGCGEGRCGACTVLIEGKSARACITPAASVAGKDVLTIEGLAPPGSPSGTGDDALHPVQAAFLAEGAFQCGYCTPGMILTTVALLRETPHPTDEQILAAVNGNLCRCCDYPRILKAVRRAAVTGQKS